MDQYSCVSRKGQIDSTYCCSYDTTSGDSVHKQVAEYYGKTLKSTSDLQTSCCTAADSSLSPAVKKARAMLHDEVLGSFYGCGSPIPPAILGATILDLGKLLCRCVVNY